VSAKLIAETGDFEGAEYPVRTQGIVLGRLKSNDVEVRDTKASRRHTRVGFAGGKWVVEDLKSSNGTFLNGSKIEARSPLVPGDKISIGKTIYRFELKVAAAGSAQAGTRSKPQAKPRPATNKPAAAGHAPRPAAKPQPRPVETRAPAETIEPEELHLEEPEELGLDDPGDAPAAPKAPVAPKAPMAPKPAERPAVSGQPLVALGSGAGRSRTGLLGGEITQRDWRYQAVIYTVMAVVFAAVVYGAFALTSGALGDPVEKTPVGPPAGAEGAAG